MAFKFESLYPTYPDVIRKMPRRQPDERWDFTSHEFIEEWSHDNQALYIEALYSQRANIPFASVHGLLAKGLNRFPQLVQAVKEIQHEDMFGRRVPCMTWKRVTTT